MKVCQVLTSSIFTLLLAGAAHAQTTSFQSGLNWTTGVWSAGVPTANSNVLIGLPGAPVVFDASASPALGSLTINAPVLAARFQQNANNLTATTVTVGSTAFGSYEQSGGRLTSESLIIGDAGNGVYLQSGGELIVTGKDPLKHLIIGANAGGVGRFELSNTGSVTANATHVGGGFANTPSSGVFVQTGGTVNVTGEVGELVIGDTSGTSGKYEMKGGTLSSKQLYVGVKGSNPTVGDRSFVHSGGTVTISDHLVLGGFFGGSSASAGSFTLQGNEATSVLTTSKVWVGVSGSGTFTQEGGTHNVILGDAAGDRSFLIAAASAGSEGVYNMKGGVLNAPGIYVGSSVPTGGTTGGKGTLSHSGGTINVSEQLIVDNGGTAATLGKYVMTGGALNTTGSGMTSGLLVIGNFEHNGGIVTVNGTGAEAGLRIDGSYTLSGGTLRGAGVKINNGTFSGHGTIGGTGDLINNGVMTFSGGNSTIAAPVENLADHTLEVSGNVALFDATVENRGEFRASSTQVTFNDIFSNAGRYFSNLALNRFEDGLEIVAAGAGKNGYLATNPSNLGSSFLIGESFHVGVADFALWETTTAVLEFHKGPDNTTGAHSLIYAGLDHGLAENGNGLLGYQKNLSWFEVVIGAGNFLITGDEDGRALYTEKLTFGSTNIAEITQQVASFSGDLKIYYDPADNPQLQGKTFNFGQGSGSVAPVPEPSAMLLVGVGAIALGFRRRSRKA